MHKAETIETYNNRVSSCVVGEKRKLLVISKAKKPRTKNRMSSEIFENVLNKYDSQQKSNKEKIILFIDNSSACLKLRFWQLKKLSFLPPNIKGKLQLSKAIVRKFQYRKCCTITKRILLHLHHNLPNDVGMITRAWAGKNNKTFFQIGSYECSITLTVEDSDDELDNWLRYLQRKHIFRIGKS